MPLVAIRENLGVVFLLLTALPLQYFLQVRYGGSGGAKKLAAGQRDIGAFKEYIDSWQNW